MFNRKTGPLAALVILAIVAAPSAYARCKADVSVGDKWTTKGGHWMHANLNVRIIDEGDGGTVKVHVGGRFHHTNGKGYSSRSTFRESTYVDTDDTMSESMEASTNSSTCRRGKGGCQIDSVTINKVSCYD